MDEKVLPLVRIIFNLFKTYANFPLWDYLIFILQPSVKECMIMKKNEEINKFVYNFMASLTEKEKKAPFSDQPCEGLKAYSEQKNSVGIL